MNLKNLSGLFFPPFFRPDFARGSKFIGSAPGVARRNRWNRGTFRPAPGLAGNTLRQIVRTSIGGTLVRVKFSNIFSSNAITLTSADIALSTGGSAIRTNTDTAMTFNESYSVIIPAGGSVWSDVYELKFPPLSDLAVTTCFGSIPAKLTGHPGSRATSYLQAGNFVAAPDLPDATNTAHWYVLDTIDVQADDPGSAIIAFGDSITDGHGSGTDKNDRWPDDLEKRLLAGKDTANISMLNMGIGGNCILQGGLGPTGQSRFERDALSQDGARWLIIFEGINDIGTSHDASVATNLIAAYQQFIAQAHEHHLRVYGSTITPFGGFKRYDSPAHEAARQAVNDWIRHSGAFDAVIDFDAMVRDPKNPAHLFPADDYGDHIHPNEHGYHVMADAIDLTLFRD